MVRSQHSIFLHLLRGRNNNNNTISVRLPARRTLARLYIRDAAGELTIDHLFTDDWAGGWRTEAVDGPADPWNHFERIGISSALLGAPTYPSAQLH